MSDQVALIIKSDVSGLAKILDDGTNLERAGSRVDGDISMRRKLRNVTNTSTCM